MPSSTSSSCANCGHPVTDKFCPRCGQTVDDRRGPLRRLVQEFLGETLSIESRLFRSLRDLFFRPGALTESFLAGKRASQLPPFRLYLVASLFFFFLFSLTPPDVSKTNVYVGDQIVGRDAPDPELNQNLTLNLTSDKNTFLDRWFSPQLKAKEERFRQMNPQVLVNAIFDGVAGALPKALILFLPLLALILKALFLRSKILYFDHFIFALHLQAFLFCLFSLSWFLPISPVYLLLLFLLVTPAYLLLAMRRFYRQGWLRTGLKTTLLIFAYLFVLLLVVAFTFAYVVLSI